MRQVVLIEQDEWEAVLTLADAGQAFADAAAANTLKGTVNRETDQGKRLLQMIKQVIDATVAVQQVIQDEQDTGS